MNKDSKLKIVIGLVAVFILGLVMFGNFTTEDETFISYTLYDPDGAVIEESWFEQLFSIVGTKQNVAGISFDVNVENTGQVPITVHVKDAEPNALDLALDSNYYEVGVGATKVISSAVIDVSQFEVSIQPVQFGVTMGGTYLYAGQLGTLPDKSGAIFLNIQPDLVASYEVSFEGSTGDDAIVDSCTPGTRKIEMPAIFECDVSGLYYNTIEVDCFEFTTQAPYTRISCKQVDGTCNLYDPASDPYPKYVASVNAGESISMYTTQVC